MNYPNTDQIPPEDQAHAIAEFAAWWESISVEQPEFPPKPQCGMCSHYQEPRTFKNGSTAWGYCKLRAEADVHPCNLPPWDSHAEQCPYYSEEVPF